MTNAHAADVMTSQLSLAYIYTSEHAAAASVYKLSGVLSFLKRTCKIKDESRDSIDIKTIRVREREEGRSLGLFAGERSLVTGAKLCTAK